MLAEAKIVTEFQVDTAAIEAAKLRYSEVDPTTKEGYALAIEGRALFRDTRIGIDKRRKELKADALAYGKRVDSVASQLTALVKPTEDALSAKIHDVDNAKAAAKEAELAAKAEAERQRLLAEQEAERKRNAEDREAIAKEKAALAELKATQDREAQERLEAEERERQAREQEERQRAAERESRWVLLRRLNSTGLPGCSFADTCIIEGELIKEPAGDFATRPLAALASLVAAKELVVTQQREAQARIEQTQREEAAAEQKRQAEDRAKFEAERAAFEAEKERKRNEDEQRARQERRERFGMLAALNGINRDQCADPRGDPYHQSKIWVKFQNGAILEEYIDDTDELQEPFASMPIAKLNELVADQRAQRKARNEKRAAMEAEEQRVAELERQAALAKRLELLKPDCEKLRIYAESIRTVPIPEFSDDTEITFTINTTIDALLNLANALDNSADMLEHVGGRTNAS